MRNLNYDMVSTLLPTSAVQIMIHLLSNKTTKQVANMTPEPEIQLPN